MPRCPRVRAPISSLLLAAALACSGGNGTVVSTLPVGLQLVVPPGALAQSGVAFNPQPVLQLVDAQHQPVSQSGVPVTAVLLGDLGALSGAVQARTDHDGKAAFSNLAVSGTIGSFRVRFDAAGLASITTDPIALGAGAAALMSVFAGNLQTAVAGAAVPVVPAVRITDGSGNPIAGVSVTFTASAGGSVDGATTTTDANGVAAPTRWVLSASIGLNTLTAASTALPGVTFQFTATGTVGPPAVLAVSAGEAQSAAVGGSVALAPAVLLTDAAGHPLPGVILNFSVASGAGSVTGAAPLTDANGIATLGGWVLGLTPGPNTLTVSRSGVPSLTLHATGVGFSVASFGLGNGHSCAIDTGGVTWCWGLNDHGQIGNGAAANDSVPTLVSGGRTFLSVTAGVFHSCGLLANGDAYCWGANDFGQLGDGTLTARSVPTLVGGGFKFSTIQAGSGYTCGLLSDGTTRCWGFGGSGQVGDGSNTNRSIPTLVSGGHVFTMLSVGIDHSCGREASGALFCWGGNGNGRLGDGTTTNAPLPVQVAGGTLFASVSAGGSHTCAVTPGGAGYCWGAGASGRLGNGATADQLFPVAMSGGLTLATVSANVSHSCARTTAGEAWCWGSNLSGELGDGTTTARLVPTLVSAGLSYSAVQAGVEHSCGRSSGGVLYCWGRNDTGAVGDGTVISRLKPVGVVKP